MSSITVPTICDGCGEEFDITSPNTFNIHPVMGQPTGRSFEFRVHECPSCKQKHGFSWMTEDEYERHIKDLTHHDTS